MSISGMSGTTMKTSFSQEELQDMDADVMIDVLPSLASAAEELAKLLVPKDPKARPVVRKEIRTAGSKYNKLYSNRVAAVNVHKHSFGSTEYLQPGIIIRGLFGVQDVKDVPNGTWGVDDVVYKINLAQMLRSVLVSLVDNSDIDDEEINIMESLDVNFPGAIAGPTFSPLAFQLCLNMLTQLAIIRLSAYHADLNFVASDKVVLAFYEQEEDGDHAFKHRDVLHMMTLSDQQIDAYTNVIQQRVTELISTFENSADAVAGLGTLRARHPWEQFVDEVIRYYEERKKELDKQISDAGGIDEIMAKLSTEVQLREDARTAQEKRQSFTKPGGTPKKGFGKAGIRALKNREKQLAASTAPVPAQAAPIAQMTVPAATLPQAQVASTGGDDWQPMGDDDQIFSPSQVQSTARSGLNALHNLQHQQHEHARKGKGRSLLDRQEGAHRVAWDDESQLTPYEVPQSMASGPYYQSPQQQSRQAKRSHAQIEDEAEDFEPTQDEGFEVDTRDMAGADHRRRTAPRSRAPQPAPRFSSSGGNSATPGPASILRTSASPSKRQRKNPGSSIPASLPPLDPDDTNVGNMTMAERLQHAKIGARHATVMASQDRPPQSRTAWTQEEQLAFIALVEEYCDDSIKYAKIKAIDDERGEEALLLRRSAEDMRFKGRNMKVQFLRQVIVLYAFDTLLLRDVVNVKILTGFSRAGMDLPRNFDKIVLDKKGIEQLRKAGIEYSQDRIRGNAEIALDI